MNPVQQEDRVQSYATPMALLGVVAIVFVVCAISPYDRAVWWAENLPVLVITGLLVWISRHYRFSNASYLLMTVFLVLHTIGGHFTFERVPFGWVSDLFGFERNHYDRVAHFSVGFYAYPIAEFLMVRRLVHSRWVLALFPIFAIATVAAGYEIIEWQYALNADAAAGIAMLGSQGDVWDAQKDILSDTLGALLVMGLFFYHHHAEIGALHAGPHRGT